MLLSLPELCLVALVGPSSTATSTFAAKHFRATEVFPSDALPHVDERLDAGAFSVVDLADPALARQEELVRLARRHHVLPVAIAFDETELHKGFRRTFVLHGEEEIDAANVERARLPSDQRGNGGPFDIVGDVHGCRDELVLLLEKLGYEIDVDRATASHPEKRQAVFVGDLVDRGPDTPGALRLVMGMVRDGSALCVPGNHDNKLLRALAGRKVHVSDGLAESLGQLEDQPEEFRDEVVTFLDELVSHVVLDEGRLVVAHAGLPERLHNRMSDKVDAFALYGQTTGETDEHGFPVRYAWATDYSGAATVVYGHTPMRETDWVNNTICVDTGCVFGGKLTALRYPERELVSVPAAAVYYRSPRLLVPVETSEATSSEATSS